MADSSFDVVSKVERQEVDNALNQAAKELAQRFDFRGTNAWLYPRLGDYAVLTATGDVALSGFFDEQWRLK